MSRAEEIRAMRRERNGDALKGARKRLAVREEFLDRAEYAYRWVNDEGNRVHLFQQDGWEITSDRAGTVKKDGAGMGAQIEQLVGTDKNGAAMKSVLMRLPKEIYDDDQKSKERAIDEREAGIKVGAVPGTGKGVYAREDMQFSGGRP